MTYMLSLDLTVYMYRSALLTCAAQVILSWQRFLHLRRGTLFLPLTLIVFIFTQIGMLMLFAIITNADTDKHAFVWLVLGVGTLFTENVVCDLRIEDFDSAPMLV